MELLEYADSSQATSNVNLTPGNLRFLNNSIFYSGCLPYLYRHNVPQGQSVAVFSTAAQATHRTLANEQAVGF